MAEEVIKTTSCCNDAMMGGLLGAMANRDSNPLAMAAMMRNRDDDDMWNNPFAYMMMMGMMRYMYGADWNNRDNGADVQRAEIQGQIESLRNQMADNQNSNLLMGAIQGLFAAQYQVLRENGHTPSEAFNETVEELSQSLMPLIAENGMDWMYANCSTTAQRGALDWWRPFRDAVLPVFRKLYESVKSGNEAQISIDSNSKPDYREKLNAELKELRESEMWQAGATVRDLRPERSK